MVFVALEKAERLAYRNVVNGEGSEAILVHVDNDEGIHALGDGIA